MVYIFVNIRLLPTSIQSKYTPENYVTFMKEFLVLNAIDKQNSVTKDAVMLSAR
jgi:hypothetical protein